MNGNPAEILILVQAPSTQLPLCAMTRTPHCALKLPPKLLSSKFRLQKVLHFCARLLSSFSLTRAVCVMLIINRNFRRHFVNCKKLHCPAGTALPTTPPFPWHPLNATPMAVACLQLALFDTFSTGRGERDGRRECKLNWRKRNLINI